MRFIYFDEVKYHPPVQPKHRIGALSVPDSAISDIEGQMNDIAESLFGTRELGRRLNFMPYT